MIVNICGIPHKVIEVFGKEYRKETLYRERTQEALEAFKLKNKSENVEEKIERLRKVGYKSDFRIKVESIE